MQMKKKYAGKAVRHYPRYPNEADRNYYMQKVLDIATGIVSGIGLIVTLVFLTAIM